LREPPWVTFERVEKRLEERRAPAETTINVVALP
jgi:hypothetical protein